jgi:pimeloyl-ACP methyl ester carboxylesterase
MAIERQGGPSIHHLFGEAQIVKQWIDGRRAYERIASNWPGNGQRVMVIPGLFSNDTSTSLLRRTLDLAGYESCGWQLGYNMPARPEILDRLHKQIDSVWQGKPLTLIGWSLGGIVARAYAHRCPERVALVVTLGSPFSGSPRDNNAWRIYELFADHSVDKPPFSVDYTRKPPVSTVAIWSAQDGIVSPHSARGAESEADHVVEISCGHFSMSCAPVALEAVLRVLSEHN